MAKEWYPGGVLFKADHVPELVRQLSRLPRSKGRERLLATITEQLPGRGKLTLTAPLVTRPASENEEQYIPLVEDAAARKRALWMRYITASRGGRVSERYVSVHVIEIGPPARFVATCHVNGDLRWFRVEGIVRAHLDENERFRDCAPKELAAFRAASLDGYKGPGAPISCSFFVREPESSWVTSTRPSAGASSCTRLATNGFTKRVELAGKLRPRADSRRNRSAYENFDNECPVSADQRPGKVETPAVALDPPTVLPGNRRIRRSILPF